MFFRGSVENASSCLWMKLRRTTSVREPASETDSTPTPPGSSHLNTVRNIRKPSGRAVNLLLELAEDVCVLSSDAGGLQDGDSKGEHGPDPQVLQRSVHTALRLQRALAFISTGCGAGEHRSHAQGSGLRAQGSGLRAQGSEIFTISTQVASCFYHLEILSTSRAGP